MVEGGFRPGEELRSHLTCEGVDTMQWHKEHCMGEVMADICMKALKPFRLT